MDQAAGAHPEPDKHKSPAETAGLLFIAKPNAYSMVSLVTPSAALPASM
jgi:hypothetical protein